MPIRRRKARELDVAWVCNLEAICQLNTLFVRFIVALLSSIAGGVQVYF